jgi:ABC-type transport system involved in cytochrome c biogenesis permease component
VGRALPVVLLLAVTVYAVVEAVMTPRERLRRKGWWLLAIVALPLVGPVLWLAVGRRSREAPDDGGGRRPPIAPDDDPDFLRGL